MYAKVAADRGDPVAYRGQARVGAADAVVGDDQADRALGLVQLDRQLLGPRVLEDVGLHLGDHEVQRRGEHLRDAYGFASRGDFENFGSKLHSCLSDAGYSGTRGIMQGSAVTGRKYTTGALFDVGRRSDFDVALAGQ